MAYVIAFAQQKGGAGKTTLAAQLAVALAESHSDTQRKIIALDGDPQGSLCTWFQRREDYGHETGALQVVPADSWRFTAEFSRAKRTADIVILDFPPRSDNSTQSALRGADLVVIPMQLSPLDMWATRPTIEAAEKLKIPSMVVFNRVPARTRLNDTVADTVRAEGWSVAQTMIGGRTALAASVMNGQGVVETEPTSIAASEIRLLAGEILGQAGEALAA